MCFGPQKPSEMRTFLVQILHKLISLLMPQNLLFTRNFTVEWGGDRIGVTEVTGLSIGVETNSYREGTDRDGASIINPGLEKTNNIVLKRGILRGDTQLYDWMKQVIDNQTEPRDLTISLLNNEYEPVLTWRVASAYPIHMEWSDLHANESVVAMESIEITHEGITVVG